MDNNDNNVIMINENNQDDNDDDDDDDDDDDGIILENFNDDEIFWGVVTEEEKAIMNYKSDSDDDLNQSVTLITIDENETLIDKNKKNCSFRNRHRLKSARTMDYKYQYMRNSRRKSIDRLKNERKNENRKNDEQQQQNDQQQNEQQQQNDENINPIPINNPNSTPKQQQQQNYRQTSRKKFILIGTAGCNRRRCRRTIRLSINSMMPVPSTPKWKVENIICSTPVIK